MQSYKDVLHILYIAAEADPLVRVGGLGDVAGALPHALRRVEQVNGKKIKIDIRLAIPYYGCISTTEYDVEKVADYTVDSTSGPLDAHVFLIHIQGLAVYLISGTPIKAADPVYSKDFESDAEKFIFFSKACLQLPHEIGWEIDILHANDWHTAVSLHELKKLQEKEKKDTPIRKILSIHNLPFMGTGSENALKHFKISPALNPNLPEWARTLPLTMGMDAADQILTVSPRYAEEIQTSMFGCDLQKYIQMRKSNLKGILNGLDTALWNPATDSHLRQTFTADSLPLRVHNKSNLQQEFDLEVNPDIPVLAYVGRMDRQKGVDLLLEVLRRISTENWQAVILGTGHKDLEEAAQLMQKDFPHKIRVVTRFDSALSHRIYAGSDILLMPSRYEPCGLAQLIAMRYGCIPVASATGGLVNTITPVTTNEDGTGFLFSIEKIDEFYRTLLFALSQFADTPAWQKIQTTAMKKNFSWDRSAQEYANVYSFCVNSQ